MNDNSERKYLKSKTISGVFWTGMERVCAQSVSVVVAIVLARLLVPDDYSVVGIITIFFTFCNLLISGGLDTALIQKKDVDTLDFSTVMFSSLLIATVMYAFMFAMAPVIAELYHKPVLISAIRVMALTFFINAYKSVVTAKVTSDLQFRRFFWATFVGTVISAFVGIVLAFRGFGCWALIAQQMTNSFIDSLVLTIASRFQPSLRFSFSRFLQLFRFGGRIFAASIINAIYAQTRPLIVGIKYTTTDLAYYNKAESFPNLITSLSSNTLSSTLFPVMSKAQDNKELLLAMTRRFIQTASFLTFPLMLGFAAVSEGFVRVVLTEKWLPIVPYIMIFCVANMLTPIQDGNLHVMRALGRSDIILKLEIWKKASYFIVIFLFVLFTNSPILLATSCIVTSLLATAFNTQPNRKLIGYSLRMHFLDFLPNLITSGIMAVLVYLMRYFPLGDILLLLLQIMAGALIYCGLNLAIKNPSLFYILKSVKEVLCRVKN